MRKRDNFDGVDPSRLIEQAAVLIACFHRMDDRFGAVIPDENNEISLGESRMEITFAASSLRGFLPLRRSVSTS